MTFLELCQELVVELGIGGANDAGTSPTTVTAQSGQLGRVVRWIAQADLDINNMWRDWTYLNTVYSESLTVGTITAPVHSGSEIVRKWDYDSFYLDYDTEDAVSLEWMPWKDYRRIYGPGAHLTNSQPSAISIDKGGTIYLNEPPDSTYTLTADFYKQPIKMTTSADNPDMPDNYHRIIVAGAAIKYGFKVAAAEVIQGLTIEYDTGLIEMQSDQAPGFFGEGISEDDQGLVMSIPGMG